MRLRSDLRDDQARERGFVSPTLERHREPHRKFVRFTLPGIVDPGSLAGGFVQGGHFGMAIMRERIEALGGDWKMVSEIGYGTAVTATIPLANPTNGPG